MGHCSLEGGRASSLSRKPAGQGEGRLTHCSTPQGLETVLEGGGGNPWVPSSCVPLSGGLCRKQLRVLEGGIHHACLTVTRRREPRRKNRSPAPGLAPQTSRCTKKAQSLLSPFSGQSTGSGGCRALLKAGGSEEAGAFSLLVPSLLSLCASSRENRELEI